MASTTNSTETIEDARPSRSWSRERGKAEVPDSSPSPPLSIMKISHVMQPYRVYIAQFKAIPIFHDAIYVEIEEGKGRLYHINGGHLSGWKYMLKHVDNLEESRHFYKKHLKGTVAEADLRKVDEICESVPMPQNDFIDGVEFPRDCRHWVLETLDRLEQEGVMDARSRGGRSHVGVPGVP